MRHVLPDVQRWLAEGEPVVLATVIDVEQRAPRGAGAALAVNSRGQVAGSVSGGCIEPAVIREAETVLRDGTARVLTFGITNEQAWEVGLSCGGTVHVFLERISGEEKGPEGAPSLLENLREALKHGSAVALVTVVGGISSPHGMRMLVSEDGSVRGSTGDGDLDRAVVDHSQKALASGKAVRVRLGDTDVFIHPFTPPPRLHIIGAVHPAPALAEAGRFLGYRVIVCDPRSPFATPERLPAAHEIVRDWPDRHLSAQGLTPRDAVCVLTHDLKFDVPAIKAALATPVGYIGVMGSRRTHERRIAALREAGVDDEGLRRLHAPIGLNIGAVTPEEMAISIVAEMVAVRQRPGQPVDRRTVA